MVRVAAEAFMYHGSGFGYNCTADGWMDRRLDPVYAARLGAPLAEATRTAGCVPKAAGECVMTRAFASGTRVWINVTDGASCVRWADGWDTPAAGKQIRDPCGAGRHGGRRLAHGGGGGSDERIAYLHHCASVVRDEPCARPDNGSEFRA